MKEESRDTDNIRDKTQNEDKQNKVTEVRHKTQNIDR